MSNAALGFSLVVLLHAWFLQAVNYVPIYLIFTHGVSGPVQLYQSLTSLQQVGRLNSERQYPNKYKVKVQTPKSCRPS